MPIIGLTTEVSAPATASDLYDQLLQNIARRRQDRDDEAERARLVAVALIRARKWDGEGAIEFSRPNAAWSAYALGSVGELTEGDDYVIHNGRNRDA